MPRVPTYDNRQEETRPIPTPYVAGSGADVGLWATGVQRIAGETARALAEQRQRTKVKADAAAIDGAVGILGSWTTERLHGPNGATRVLGEDAWSPRPIVDTVMEEFNEKARELRDGLAREDQQQQFDAAVLPIHLRTQTFMLRHADAQQTVVEQARFKARESAAHDSAVSFAHDTEQMITVLREHIANIERFGDDHGLPQEAVGRQIVEFRSGALRDATLALIDQKRLSMARELFDDVKDDSDNLGPMILPGDRRPIERVLEPAEDAEKALLWARELTEGIDTEPTAADLEQIEKKRRTIKQPALLAEFDRQVGNELGRIQHSWDMRQKEAFDRSWTAVLNGTSFRDLPPADVADLGDGQHRRLMTLEADLRKPTERATDFGYVYGTWRNMSPQEKASFDLRNFYEHADQSMINRLWTEQKEWQKFVAGKATNVFTTQQQIGARIKKLSLESDLAGRFEDRAQQLILQKTEQLGHPPNDLEVREILDRMSVELTMIEEDGGWGWFDAQAPTLAGLVPSLPADRIKTVGLTQPLPAAERTLVENYLRDQNVTAKEMTEQRISNEWALAIADPAHPLNARIAERERQLEAREAERRVQAWEQGMSVLMAPGVLAEDADVQFVAKALRAKGERLTTANVREAVLLLKSAELVAGEGEGLIPPEQLAYFKRRAAERGRDYQPDRKVLNYYAALRLFGNSPDAEHYARTFAGLPYTGRDKLSELLLQSPGR